MEQDHEVRIDVLMHEAMNGRLHTEKVKSLDPSTRDIILAIHRRHRVRAQAEQELRKFRQGGELGTYGSNSFVFTVLADYVIDAAIQREAKKPASLEQHRQHIKRMWYEYKNRILSYGY